MPSVGYKQSEEHRRRRSERQKGISRPHGGCQKSTATKQRIGDANRGRPNPFKGMPRTLCGENHPCWKGGVSFSPYCVKFSREFKERVRAFFGYECVECHMTTEENGRALDVHHVNYDKMMCCNDVKPLFVSLCHKHNSVANHNREWWQSHFTEIINIKYNGQCYIPKESTSCGSTHENCLSNDTMGELNA